MKVWRCPHCRTSRVFEKELVMKVCDICQVEMVVEDGK